MLRTIMAGLLAMTGLCFAEAVTTAGFSFEHVQAKARELAAQPYVAPPENLPAWMQSLNYDQHRGIAFVRDHAWWQAEKLPFQLQFFHPGWLFKSPVKINEVVAGQARPIPYSPALFDYGELKPGQVPAALGFAGLRIHYPLVLPGDELAVFLGASYFRAVGRGMHYGLSARGLAINTGEAGPEEFPRFGEFWLARPEAGSGTVTLFALLDGPSVAGAYRFELTPGDETVMEVHATLYFRRHPAVVGLAPLTSMFMHGENTGWSKDDFRPEVHDSDGLLLLTGTGERIWRPLANPAAARVSSFFDRSPKGYGLMQRDRDLAHYEDLEANYHLRPGAWVEPLGDWGEGAVRLLEFHTPDETNDNIAACWVPAQLPAIGEPLTYSYRLHWLKEPAGDAARVKVASTRQSAVLGKPGHRQFVLDFTGLPFDGPPRDVRAVVSVGPGAKQVGPAGVQALAPLGVWRVVIELEPDGSGRPVELRCHLQEGPDSLSETWSNLWTP